MLLNALYTTHVSLKVEDIIKQVELLDRKMGKVRELQKEVEALANEIVKKKVEEVSKRVREIVEEELSQYKAMMLESARRETERIRSITIRDRLSDEERREIVAMLLDMLGL